MNKVAQIAGRLFIVFGCAAIIALPLGDVFGVSELQAALFAGLAATSLVVQKLAKAYVADGRLTNQEIDDAFSTEAEQDETEN
jgi:hypothetical protein